MSNWELFVVALGLSMDAFAVSVGKGLSVTRTTGRQTAAVGLWFGGFQALMPLLGFAVGARFGSLISDIDHWIAFVLLALIGAKMLWETRESAERTDASFAPKAMFPLAVATSIDALAVGVTFAFLGVSIGPAVATIGAVTVVASATGLKIGNVFGAKYKARAEIFGGIILIGIGLKILLEHLGVLG